MSKSWLWGPSTYPRLRHTRYPKVFNLSLIFIITFLRRAFFIVAWCPQPISFVQLVQCGFQAFFHGFADSIGCSRKQPSSVRILGLAVSIDGILDSQRLSDLLFSSWKLNIDDLIPYLAKWRQNSGFENVPVFLKK